MGDQTIKILYTLAGICGAIMLALYAYVFIHQRIVGNKSGRLKIGASELNVEVADSLVAQQRGLSGRESLPSDSGMLFVYKDKAIRHFWMPNMRFPLDVLWIADGQVVGLQENIPPLTGASITRFQSSVPADTVLEVNSGWIAAHQARVGQTVNWAD